MSISNNLSYLNLAASASSYSNLIQDQFSPDIVRGNCEGPLCDFEGLRAVSTADSEGPLCDFEVPWCDFEGLRDLPIEQALDKLMVVIQINPQFFIDNYVKLPPLSADQALPLLTILVEITPFLFVTNFEKFPALSGDQALPLLSILTRLAPDSFADNYEKFPFLSAEQAFPLLMIVAEKDHSSFIRNYLKFSILYPDQLLVLLRIIAEKDHNSFIKNYGKFSGLSSEQVFVLLKIVIKRIFSSKEKVNSQYSLSFILEAFKVSNSKLTMHFLNGMLKTLDDIPLIEHIIQSDPFFQDPSMSDMQAIVSNLSKETAYPALVGLIKYHRNLFSTYFPLIFTHLTTPIEGEISAWIDERRFFEVAAFSEIKIDPEKTLDPIWAKFCEFKRIEDLELRKKDGELWVCVGRKKQPEGYYYIFRFRPEFAAEAALHKKTNEIYPAIEVSIGEFFNYLSKLDYTGLLAELGYSLQRKEVAADYNYLEDDTITIPDRKSLIYRYNQIKTHFPYWAELPELSIISSPGIASDADFVQALMKCDGLISEGKEFIHDQIIHIIPLLKTAEGGSDFYIKTKKLKIDWFQSYVDKINLIKEEAKKTESSLFGKELSEKFLNNLPILETLLGALVDTIGSKQFRPRSKIETVLVSLEEICTSAEWIAFFQKRYNGVEFCPKFDQNIIRELAKFIDELKL
jgi:hypothetical protein